MLERMDKFFDRRLDEYDAHQLGCIASAREFLRFTAEQLPSGAGCAVLDLGCGTGLELEEYFAINPTASVAGHAQQACREVSRQGCADRPGLIF